MARLAGLMIGKQDEDWKVLHLCGGEGKSCQGDVFSCWWGLLKLVSSRVELVGFANAPRPTKYMNV